MKKDEKELSIEDLWEQGEDYVSVSNEQLALDLKANFKKNSACLYLEKKDFDKILSIKKTSYEAYANKVYGDTFTLEYNLTETVAGDFTIFERFKEYRGTKVYSLGDDDLFLIENKKGVRYVFSIYDFKSVKGINNTLVFVDGDGDLLIYDIDKDEFTEEE